MSRSPIGWFFAPHAESASPTRIVLWWELRRIPFNLIVGLAGLCSLFLFFAFISMSGKLAPGEDAVEPMALLAAPFIINAAYTAGWIVELSLHLARGQPRATFAPMLLKLGVSFSLAVVALPSAFWGSYVLLQSMGVLH